MAGCGASADPSARTDEAEANARQVVTGIVTELRGWPSSGARTADDIGRALAARPETDLVAISGVDTAHPGGVTAVLRVVGTGTDGSWLEPEWVEEQFCFELHFELPAPASSPTVPAGTAAPAFPPTVPCPSAAARLTFPPPTESSVPSPEELRTALSGAAADETGVRTALAGLSLGPTVRTDVASRNGAVGVALRYPLHGSGRYGCVFALVRTGRVEAWRPASAQVQPGELACLATESLAGHGSQPPA